MPVEYERLIDEAIDRLDAAEGLLMAVISQCQHADVDAAIVSAKTARTQFERGMKALRGLRAVLTIPVSHSS